MKKLALAALAAVALVCLPLLVHAQSPAAPPPVDTGAAIAAAEAHNWQALAAVLLPLVAWGIRRAQSSPLAFVHTPAGALVIACGLALVGAFAPVLVAHALTWQAAISAATTAVLSLLAMSNPKPVAAATAALALLLLSASAWADPPPPAVPAASAAAVVSPPAAAASVSPASVTTSTVNAPPPAALDPRIALASGATSPDAATCAACVRGIVSFWKQPGGIAAAIGIALGAALNIALEVTPIALHSTPGAP